LGKFGILNGRIKCENALKEFLPREINKEFCEIKVIPEENQNWVPRIKEFGLEVIKSWNNEMKFWLIRIISVSVRWE